jgi:hypothetical protein
MTSTAHFQELTGDKNGIIRLFEHPNREPPDKYKFFVVGCITNKICTIYGMYDSDINRHDFRAIYNCLKEIGVIKAEWIHNGKYHSRNIL